MTPRLHQLQIAGSAVESGYTLAYWSWGDIKESSTPVLCVHGLTRNGRDFDFLAQGLAKNTQIICPDLPGRGKSSWLTDTADYNYGTYTSCLLKLLDSMDIRQVDWVGTSLGGILGMRVAAERPQMIRKLVLNDVGAVISIAGFKRINSYVGMSMNFSGREAAEKHLREIYADFGITDDRHWQHLLEHSFSEMSNGEYQLSYDPGILAPLRDKNNKLQPQENIELWEWWDEIQCPTLIIRGEHSDILLAETAQEMLKRNARAELETIRGIGHAPTLMPAEQVGIVSGWLQK